MKDETGGQRVMSMIWNCCSPAGVLMVAVSPFLSPRSPLAMGVPTDSLPALRLASESVTMV